MLTHQEMLAAATKGSISWRMSPDGLPFGGVSCANINNHGRILARAAFPSGASIFLVLVLEVHPLFL
jgi:hypothetical protein